MCVKRWALQHPTPAFERAADWYLTGGNFRCPHAWGTGSGRRLRQVLPNGARFIATDPGLLAAATASPAPAPADAPMPGIQPCWCPRLKLESACQIETVPTDVYTKTSRGHCTSRKGKQAPWQGWLIWLDSTGRWVST